MVKMVKDREAWHAAVHGVSRSRKRTEWTTTTKKGYIHTTVLVSVQHGCFQAVSDMKLLNSESNNRGERDVEYVPTAFMTHQAGIWQKRYHKTASHGLPAPQTRRTNMNWWGNPTDRNNRDHVLFENRQFGTETLKTQLVYKPEAPIYCTVNS